MGDKIALKHLVTTRFGVSDWSINTKDIGKYPLEKVLEYCALDSYYTLKLYELLSSEMGINMRVYKRIMIPVLLEFLQVELRGVPVELDRLNELEAKFGGMLDGISEEILKGTGGVPLNPQSPKQLVEYLQNKNYQLTVKTKTGYSTSTDVMEELNKKYTDKVIEKVLEYRKISKIKSTFLTGIKDLIGNDGRLHPSYNLTKVVTGRTSSDSPNIQNIPKREFSECRSIVKAPEGYKIVSFDYGQIEARLFAVLTGDPTYHKDLMTGYDIHKELAEKIKQEKPSFDPGKFKDIRTRTKNALTFPALYGAGAESIGANLKVSKDQAQRLLNDLFNRYPMIKEWQKDISVTCERDGYLRSLFGKVRRMPMSWNMMLNFPPQSAASDITCSAMLALSKKYPVLFMIHDDLTFMLKEDEIAEAGVEIAKVMVTVPWCYMTEEDLIKQWVPLQVECSVGDDWSNQKEIFAVDSIALNFNSYEDCLKEGLRYI